MYRVVFKQGYTQLMFTFKEFIDASCFMKQALENGSGDFTITIDMPDEKEGDE